MGRGVDPGPEHEWGTDHCHVKCASVWSGSGCWVTRIAEDTDQRCERSVAAMKLAWNSLTVAAAVNA